jgi:hypothetical protein
VVTDNGPALHLVADRDDQAIEFVSTAKMDALGHAVNYLRDRFGVQGQVRTCSSAGFDLSGVGV